MTDGVVTLRLRTRADVALIAASLEDPDTRRWLDGAPTSADDPDASLSRSAAAYESGESAPLTIADAVTDEALGLLNVQFRNDVVATLAYSVFPAARGRGVASRAVDLVRPWAFGPLGVADLRLEIDPANLSSVRVAEKSGWLLLPGITTEEGKLVYVSRRTSGHPAPTWAGVTVDAVDVTLVAGFWSALLHSEPRESLPGWLRIGPLTEGGPVITVQPVPEPASGKVRLHLDLRTTDLPGSVAEVERLGGRRTDERHDYPEGVVQVMADPEGHEFCLVWLRGEYA